MSRSPLSTGGAFQPEADYDVGGDWHFRTLPTVGRTFDPIGALRGDVNVVTAGAVGDGYADDTVAIRASVAAVPTGGGRVLFPAGIYRLAQTLTIARSDVTLCGVGPASILRATAATFPVITLGAVQRVLIRDLTIQGAATSSATSQFGILSAAAAPATDCRIDRVRFSGPDAATGCNSGIKFDTGADRHAVVGCTFERLIGTIQGTGYGVLLGAANDCLITGNRFLATAGQGRHAVYISAGSSYAIVAQNLVRGFAEEAITVNATAANPTCAYNQILGNTVVGGGALTTDSGGIAVYGDALHTTIAQNVITGFNGWGIVVTDAGQGGLNQFAVVRGNRVVDSQLGGIVVMGAKNATISGNYVYNNGQSSPGSFNGIEVRSVSSGGAEVADGTSILGNDSLGTVQRNACNINASAPAPTNTVILGNRFGAGAVGTLQLNGVAVTAPALLATGASQTVDQVITVLQTLGLVRQT